MNFDPSFIKQQSERMGEMSDDELNRAKSSIPGYGSAMTPEMMRNASKMMGDMSPDQINDMMKMYQNMPGMPQMPGMPNMNPYGGYQQPQTPQYTAPSKKEEEQPFENPNSQKKFESVTEVKDKANKLFKANELDKACEKYFEAINNIRATECLKESPQGRRLEINCRINLALCKIKQEKYDEAIDQ